MILEGSEKRKDDCLTTCGYRYIDIWRRTTFVLNQVMRRKELSVIFWTRANRRSEHLMEGNIDSSYSTKEQSEETKKLYLSRDHRPLASNLDDFITQHPVCQRMIGAWKRESAEGLSLKDPPNTPILARMLRTLSEWKLSPYQLIYEIEKDLNELADPAMQSLFYLLFFRSPVSEDADYLGAGDLICEDQALLIRCQRFIQKGLSHFERSDQGSAGARFFFEFSYYLGNYLPERHLKKLCDMDALNKWIHKTKISEKDRGAFHLYRILFFSLKDPDALKPDEFGCIYESWIKFQLNQQDPQWRSPTAERSALEFILKLTGLLENKLTRSDDFRHEVFVPLMEGKWKWRPSSSGHPIYDATNETDGTKASIELSTGRVRTPFGLLKGTPNPREWDQEPTFKRLFPNGDLLNYHSIGNAVAFTHPRYGPFRLIPDTQSRYLIECQFPGSTQWFQYSDPVDSGILASDHSFWVPTGQPVQVSQDITISGYFCSLKDHRRRFAMTMEGRIIEIDPNSGRPPAHARSVCYLAAPKERCAEVKAMTDFDQGSNILLYSNEKDQIEMIQFPRYVSLEGNPLNFILEEQGYIWTENRQYILREKKHVGLGALQQYLFLSPVHSNGCHKILIPFGEMTEDLEGKCLLKPLMDGLEENANQEQWGKYVYLTYDVLDDDVVSHPLEGKLFLSYLRYSQEKYQDAVLLIKEIQPTDRLSKRSVKTLDLILSLAPREDHPEAKMVHFFAVLALIRHLEKTRLSPPKYTLECKHIPRLMKSVQDSLQALNNISISLRLSCEEEKLILETLLHDYLYWMKDLGLIQGLKSCASRIALRLDSLKTGGQRIVPVLPVEKAIFPSERIKHEPIHLPYKPRPISRQSDESNQESARRMGNYKSDLLLYQNGLMKIREWSACGSLAFERYIRPDPNIPLDKNGQLVFESLRLAKNDAEDARRDLLYRLLMWQMHAKGPSNDLSRAITILCADANQLPDPISLSQASDEELVHAIEQLNKALRSPPTLKEAWEKISGKESDMDQAESPSKTSPAPKLSEIDHLPIKRPSSTFTIQIKLSAQARRWNQLEAWKEKYMKAEDSLNEEGAVRTLSIEDVGDLISPDDEAYQATFKQDLELLKEELYEGKKLNESISYLTIDRPGCTKLQEAAKQELELLQIEKSKAETKLIRLANRRTVHEIQQIRDLARIGGGSKKMLSIDDCIDCLLSFDGSSYQFKNPNIDKPEHIVELAETTLEVEDLKSHIAQLERVCALTQEISQIDSPDSQARRFLCQKLAVELDARYWFEEFTQEEQVIFRVFCGETTLIPYKRQMTLIKKALAISPSEPEKYQDIVCQLMSGDGKTSVIALLLLYLAARRKGRIALFIVPSALYETVKKNLSQSMLKAFHKQIQALDVSRRELTPYRLSSILRLLEDSKEQNRPIITNPPTIQIIDLEFFSIARMVKDLQKRLSECKDRKKQLNEKLLKCQSNPEPPTSQLQEAMASDLLARLKKQDQHLDAKMESLQKSLDQSLVKLKLLYQIDREISNHGDALVDEFDVVFDCHHEVNIPSGDQIPIESAGNYLLYRLYEWLASDDLAKTVRLQSNDQAYMTREEYQSKVRPLLAKQVAEFFEPIKEHVKDFKEPFIRFIEGAISTDPTEKDQAFLTHLNNLYLTEQNDNQEMVNLISLTRHYFLELLLETLKQSGNRNYGLKPNDPKGKIIQYHAVDTPTIMEFGYQWEEACCNYQWAAAFPIEEWQVAEFAKVAQKLADHFIRRDQENLDETAEFETFHRLFNVPLDKIWEPGMLQFAAKYISKDVKKRLEYQFEMVSQNVKYYSERLSSNGANLVDQLSSCRVVSATPGIADGLAPSLSNHIHLDRGAEGRVIDMLIKRDKEGKIHTVELTSLKKMMDDVLLNHPTPKKIRGIIESGALFKAFKSNANVAEHLMNYLADRQKTGHVDPAVCGVLFFHPAPGQEQPDTLYVWRKGASRPEKIGGTTKRNLEDKGLDPSKYFIYFDERQTTGQDIPQVPEAINLFTFDVKMTRRNLVQGFMRLRLYLYSQDIEIVLTAETKRVLFNQGKRASDLVLASEKQQSFAKTRDMVRYFRQQIHGLFRLQAKRQIQRMVSIAIDGALPDNFADQVEKCEKFFVSQTKIEPYHLHGSIHPLKETKMILRRYLNEMLSSFKEVTDDQEQVQEALKKTKELEAHIDKATCLPEKIEDKRSLVGVHIHLEEQVEQLETALEEWKVEEELQLELQFYEQVKVLEIQKDKEIPLATFTSMLEALRNESSHEQVNSLQAILRSLSYGLDEKPIEYAKAFSEPLFGTQAFFYTCQNQILLPIFHKLQKPPTQILAIGMQDGSMRWLFVSEHEANSVREHLQTLYAKHDPLVNRVWFVQPDGSLLIQGEKTAEFPLFEDCVEKGLFEINVLLGDAQYCDQHMNEFEIWLQNNPEVKIRFMKVRTAKDAKQNRILRSCRLVADLDPEEHHRPAQQQFLSRIKREKAREGNFKPDRDQMKRLPPRKVRFLNPNWVKYLGMDIEPNELEELTPLCRAQFAQLTPKQIPYLAPEQIKWLPVDMVTYLEKPEQIYRHENGGQYYLNQEQAQKIKKHQKHLIPYLNPQFYSSFTQEWQIREVPNHHVKALAGKQMPFLPLDKVKYLVSPNQIVCLSVEQAQMLTEEQAWLIPYLNPDVYGSLKHQWQIDKVPPEHIHRISWNVIYLLEDPLQIKGLSTDQVPLLRGKQVKHVDPSQVPFLVCSHIEWLPLELVKHLAKPEQIFNKDKGKYYLTLEQTIKLTESQAHLIPFVNPEYYRIFDQPWQIHSVPNQFVKRLVREQVPLLPLEKIEYLERPEQIGDAANGTFYLSIEQAARLRENQAHLIPFVNPEYYHIFDQPWQIQQIPLNRMKWVTQKQARHLSDDQKIEYRKQRFTLLSNPQPMMARETERNERRNERRNTLKMIGQKKCSMKMENSE